MFWKNAKFVYKIYFSLIKKIKVKAEIIEDLEKYILAWEEMGHSSKHIKEEPCLRKMVSERNNINKKDKMATWSLLKNAFWPL